MKKIFAEIDPTTGRTHILRAESNLEDPSMAPVIESNTGKVLEELTPSILRGQSPEEFVRGKRPRIVTQRGKPRLDRWEDKHSGLSATLDTPPTADGDPGTIELDSGLPNATYRLEISRSDVCVSLDEGQMELSGSGTGAFSVKVYGAGDFTVKILPRGEDSFVPVELEVPVGKARF